MRGRKNFRKVSAFGWTDQRSAVAVALAEGYTQQEIARECKITDRTIRNWLAETEFAAEVDRLSLMVGISGRAERLRIAMRVVRSKTLGGMPITEKDILDWLKFAQSETDGVKLDLAKIAAALGEDDAPMASRGQDGGGETEAGERVN